MQATLFELPLQQALSEVLESMCFLFIEEDSVAREDSNELHIERSLEFCGPFSGSFGMRVPFATASVITCNLLGQEPELITPELVGESLGEIVNMVCGSVLCRINDKDKFDLTTPHTNPVTSKPPFTPNGSRRSFQIAGGRLEVWMEIEQTS